MLVFVIWVVRCFDYSHVFEFAQEFMLNTSWASLEADLQFAGPSRLNFESWTLNLVWTINRAWEKKKHRPTRGSFFSSFAQSFYQDLKITMTSIS